LGLLSALRLAASINDNTNTSFPDLEEFGRILNEELIHKSPVKYLEDPPSDIFTDNAEFPNGNCTIYTGSGVGESFVLTNLLKAALLDETVFTNDFYNAIWQVSISTLVMSNEIARRSGHERYIDGEAGFSNEIILPPIELFTTLKKLLPIQNPR